MSNELIKKIFNKMDYNTYAELIERANKISFLSDLTSRLLAYNDNKKIKTIRNLLKLLSSIPFFISISHNEIYTKDVSEISELYNQFIKNYNELNKMLNLTNPVEINTLFSNLLYDGYLSKDKKFEFSEEQIKDIYNLSGADIITGKGVCRNISATLTDILNDYGIKSSQLSVFYDDSLEDIEAIKNELNRFLDEILCNDNQKLIKELLKKIINKNHNTGLISDIVSLKKGVEKIFGNHEITYSINNDKIYFLDPTHSTVYRLSKENRKILLENDEKVLITFQIKTNHSKCVLNVNKELFSKYKRITKEKEEKLIKETNIIYKDNKDIFDKFYSDNNELYGEISNKLLSIKKSL